MDKTRKEILEEQQCECVFSIRNSTTCWRCRELMEIHKLELMDRGKSLDSMRYPTPQLLRYLADHLQCWLQCQS